ncbi:flagellar basal body protein [Piscinibacter sp.]|jgi:flagellar basal body rod protein FlgF|uniref:flagellar basal body protein n=1 Tax=Piscinibacter sp. TaxID=1903157 RepID=UPI002F4196F4
MNSVSSIASAGMGVALQRIEAAANNIANAQTPGFRRQLVAQQARAGGGVDASIAEATLPGANLAEDIVQQMAASIVFKANLRMFQTEQRTLGSLLDVSG